MHPCPDISELIEATNVVSEFFTEQDQILTSMNSPIAQSIYSLSVSPNPTKSSSEISVQLDKANQVISSYELMNLSGVILQSGSNLNNPQLNIPIDNLAVGVYILVVRNAENQSALQKFVVN